jgi:nitrite reductase (NADH) large subunit
MRLVVVGNGMVGHRLVSALRDRDTAGRWEVTVLAEEGRPAYDRVRLSAWFDGEDLDLPELPGVTVRLGEPARSIDRADRTVTTDAGRYPYDALVLATGSYPFVPPVPGRDLPGCFVYRTIDDLESLRAIVEDRAAGRGGRPRGGARGPGARTGVVVGGGLLGLEAANALRGMGLATHVVEFAGRLMPMQVDDAGGAMLRRHIEDLGLTVHTSRAAARVVGEQSVRQVAFEDG